MMKDLIEKIKKLDKRKKIIISLIAGFILILISYQIFSNGRKSEFELFEVKQGKIVQDVFETGQVTKGERVNLAFKNIGQIEGIYVEVGDEVEAGQKLAKLDTLDVDIQLQEARISFESAQLNLNKLLAGASLEEIQISETQAESARNALDIAKKNLKNSYDDVIIVLDSSYSSIYNSLDFVRAFIRAYIAISDTDARKIMKARDKVESTEKEAKEYLELAKKSLKEEDIEAALFSMKNSLEIVFNNLEIIREIIDNSSFYRNNVLAADRTLLSTLKSSVNIALSNTNNSEQAVSSMKLSVKTAEKNLQEAENRLGLIKAEARETDIDLYQAQIRQARTRVDSYRNQIEQSKLVSPINGKVVEIRKRPGEMAQPSPQDPVIVILPFVPYEVKVNIYEGDVVKINPGDSVEISLVAFPKQIFQGKIISINPAEKIIDRVVYYEAAIGFEEVLENIMPGMTADIIIKVDFKKDVLIIHRDAIQRRNGRRVVEVFKDGLIEEREIETGARGIDDMEEVISGLNQGDKILIRR